MKQIIEKNLYKNIVENFSDEIIVTDPGGNVVYVNDVAVQHYGVAGGNLIGKNIRDLESVLFYPSASLQVLDTKEIVEIMQKTTKGKRLFVEAKPIYNDDGELTNVISYSRELLNMRKLTKQINLLESTLIEKKKDQHDPEFQRIDSNNGAMQKTLDLMIRSARTDKPIIIKGETGSGKNTLAERIHYLSHRNRGLFRKINCVNYAETVLDNGEELKRLMDGGTLYLDKIDEMPLDMQLTLLDFIENKGEGSLKDQQESMNIRFIASTEANIEKLVKQGKFREDLYYRLHIIPLEIPPLRQRKEDIYLLTMAFLNTFNEEYSRSITISSFVMNTFYEYEWPGNIQELENLIERLVIVSDTNEVKMSQLPSNVKLGSISQVKTLPDKMEQFEQSLILEAYDLYGSSYKVAESLGISQSTATRKIKKYMKENLQTFE